MHIVRVTVWKTVFLIGHSKVISEIHSWTVLLVVEIVPANFFQIRGLSFFNPCEPGFQKRIFNIKHSDTQSLKSGYHGLFETVSPAFFLVSPKFV